MAHSVSCHALKSGHGHLQLQPHCFVHAGNLYLHPTTKSPERMGQSAEGTSVQNLASPKKILPILLCMPNHAKLLPQLFDACRQIMLIYQKTFMVRAYLHTRGRYSSNLKID